MLHFMMDGFQGYRGRFDITMIAESHVALHILPSSDEVGRARAWLRGHPPFPSER